MASAVVIASSSKTILDLADGKSMSVNITSNQPRTQIYDANTAQYIPDWSTSGNYVELTPVIYLNSVQQDITGSAMSITWTKRDGSNEPTALETGETVTNGKLKVTRNKLGEATSKMVTYIVHVAYTDPESHETVNVSNEITFSMTQTGINAQTLKVSGSQILKYANGVATPSPSYITLTADLQNGGGYKILWQYQTAGGQWNNCPTDLLHPNNVGESYVIYPEVEQGQESVWNGNVATIRACTTSNTSPPYSYNGKLQDTISLYKVYDGGDGEEGKPASIVFLSNESIAFPANTQGVTRTDITETCNVVAYTGTEKVTPTVGQLRSSVAGIALTKGSAVNHEIPITITVPAGSTLGSSGQVTGTINVPITTPVETELVIHWAKLNQGETGEDAVIFTIYAPNGDVFQNKTGTLPLTVMAYKGKVSIVGDATYQWSKFSGGSFVPIVGATAATYQVSGDTVEGLATFQCAMTYDGHTYLATYTLEDKTDNYQATIESTAGDVFRNTSDETYLSCRVWQNGVEIDPLKSANMTTAANPVGNEGNFYYRGMPKTDETRLMRYSGTAWQDVTNNDEYKHILTYKWYRRNKNGESIDTTPHCTGKVIYIQANDVDTKMVYVCEVE